MLFKSLSFLFSAITVALAATLEGSANITPQDYESLVDAVNNPPACGNPYNTLDLTRITAVQTMDTSSTCGLCLKVTNAEDTSKSVYVLAVDLGGVGLDLSIPSFEKLFGQRYDPSPATWKTVDNSYCAGIDRNSSTTTPSATPSASGSSSYNSSSGATSSAAATSSSSLSHMGGYLNHNGRHDRHVSKKEGSTASQKQAAHTMTPPKNNGTTPRPAAPTGSAVNERRPHSTRTASFSKLPSISAGHTKMPSPSPIDTASLLKRSGFWERFYRRAVM